MAQGKQSTRWLFLLLPLAATVLAVLLRPDAILLTPDSLAYQHAGQTFVNGGGFEYFGYSTPMIQWAPLMPAVCGVVSLFTADVAGVMAVLNFVFLFATLAVACLAAGEYLKDRRMLFLCRLVLCFSYPMIVNYYYLWSECLFHLFLALLLYCFARWCRTGRTRDLIGCGVAGGLLMFARFSGMELSVLVGVFVLLRVGMPWIKRLKNACIYGAIAGVPFAAWLIYNFAVSGSFTGRSKPALATIGQNVHDFLVYLAEWFFPNRGGMMYVTAGLWALCAAAALVLYLLIRKRLRLPWQVWLLAAHLALYSVSILYSNSVYALDGVTTRIMSPMFITAMILLFWLFENVGALRSLHRPVLACAAVLTALTLCGSVLKWSGAPDLTCRYVRENFADDELIAFVQTLPQDVKIISNQPNEIYYMTQKDVNYPPRHQAIDLYRWDAWQARLAGRTVYVVWYDVPTNKNLYNLDELKAQMHLTTVQTTERGVILKAEME